MSSRRRGNLVELEKEEADREDMSAIIHSGYE